MGAQRGEVVRGAIEVGHGKSCGVSIGRRATDPVVSVLFPGLKGGAVGPRGSSVSGSVEAWPGDGPGT